MFKEKSILVLLLFLIFVNLILFNFTKVDYHTDGHLYNGIAQAILKGSNTIPDLPEINRGIGEDIGSVVMPGYSYIIAFVFEITGNDFMNFIFFQVLFSLFGIYLFYQTSLQFLVSQRWAMFSTFWLGTYLPLWKHNFQFLMESVTAVLLILVLLQTINYHTKKSKFNTILLGVYWFLLVAVNNRFILHFCIFAIFDFFLGNNKFSYHFVAFNWKKPLLYVSVFILLLLPWHIRQYNHYQELMLFSPARLNQIHHSLDNSESILNKNRKIEKSHDLEFLSYYQAKQYLSKGGVVFGGSKYYIKKFTPEKYETLKNSYRNNEGWRKYTSRLLGFFEIFRTDFQLGFGGNTRRILPPTIYGPNQIAYMLYEMIYLLPMFLLLIPAVFFGLRDRNMFSIILFLLFISHVFVHTLVHYYYRYRVTIVPVLFLLGFYGMQQLCISRGWNSTYIKRKLFFWIKIKSKALNNN